MVHHTDYTQEMLEALNDVHFGIHRDNVERFRTIAMGQPGVLKTYADGDGWHVWAEPPNTDPAGTFDAWDGRGDNNDPTTMHVIARVPSTTHQPAMDAVEALVSVARATGLVVPMSPCDYQGGEIAVLTDSVDWSQLHTEGGKVRTWK